MERTYEAPEAPRSYPLVVRVALALVGDVPTDPSSYATNIVPFAAPLLCPLVVGMAFALSLRPGQEYAA